MSTDSTPLLLGSASPRRSRLLRELGVAFETAAPQVRELHRVYRPRWTVRENALRKNAWCRARYPRHRVLTADTVVVFRGRCIGKPESRDQAVDLLRMFSGKAQSILTAVAYARPGEECRCEVVKSRVTFKVLTEAVVLRYLAEVDPMDKAGAYDIAQHGDLIIESCTGSRSNVAGLPVETVREWLCRPAP
jgi:septum formation protein